MTYALIDPILNAWAERRKVVLSHGNAAPHRRFFHLSSPKGETFQVVIEPEEQGIVRMDAHLIETWDDEEVHYAWDVPLTNLRQTLDLTAKCIEAWFGRE